jgi:two-component system cell cycle response regulator DivK
MSRTVLLIEDNEQNRYLTTFLLERRGYRVVSAPNGVSGVDMARRISPDIILLDIQLPTMDGFAVARALRQMSETGVVPVIAVTSYAMQGDREKCLEAGCSGYLEKPINPDTFVSEMEAISGIAPAEQSGA